MAQQQQTILRVQVNNTTTPSTGITQYEILDLYSSIPILVSRSYAELQNISVRNSDYTYNIQLPGSKKNNKFFEEFYNVDMRSLYFNVNQQVACNVLIQDEVYFKGYLRLNKINVLNSKVEYDVTLYSVVGSLFGNIGNGLLNELDFDDPEYTFNHTFNQGAVTAEWNTSNFGVNGEQPAPFFYPVVHNGYLYSGNTVNTSGGTIGERTHLYTSTSPIGSYSSLSSLTGTTGYKQYRINSPTQGLFDNQLKPGLSIWNLIKLMFKTYGYSIKSDFFNTPWMKSLYLYGYFSSSLTKFSYTITQIPSLGLESVDLVKRNRTTDGHNYIDFFVCKKNTGIPCYCADVIQLTVLFGEPYDPYNNFYYEDLAIQPNTTGTTIENVYPYFWSVVSSDVPISTKELQYFPKKVGETVPFIDGETVKFSEVIDQNLKQIDLLSSIAKKFNLIFLQSPDNPTEIIIEPYNYYVGTGDIWDWTDKLSYDKGFSVEPALNYVDSNLIFTDSDDTDYGNEQFKKQNKTIYGQMFVYNQTTNFKSTTGQTTTIFSPEVVRQWDTIENEPSGQILLPLGINYVGSSNTTGDFGSEVTNYTYTGLKSKPKLMFYLGAQNVFLDTLGEVYNNTYQYRTYQVGLLNSDGTAPFIGTGSDNLPIISHTMPMGLEDQYKINNDSASILFNSEPPLQIGTVKTYNCYTENDAYTLFYGNRINNLQSANTRFLKGKFYLKLNDYKNLKANDLIKINDQYFTWNKINGYNLTDTELTEVELVQANNNPSTYPTRYFKYQYCDQTGYTFKLKTDFTNPSLLDTNFGWSVGYDHNMGTIFNASGTTPSMLTGFTSMFADDGYTGTTIHYVPYTTNEISEDEYNNSGYYDWHYDTLRNYIWSSPGQPVYGGAMPTYWLNSGSTQTGLNLYTNCASCYSAVTTYHILTGSSQHYGPPVLPTATPTPTPTGTNVLATPTPTGTPVATPTNTATPTKTPAAATPTPTPTIPSNQCIWSQDTFKWSENANRWGSCSTVLVTPTPTPTLTPSPTSTPLTPIYQYKLGTGTTSTNACNNYNPPLNNTYYSYCPPSGFTNGCDLYKTSGYPLTDKADNGFYANSGYTWYVTAGVMVGQSQCTYTPTPTPTPTTKGTGFGIYTGATYISGSTACYENHYPDFSVWLTAGDAEPTVGDYFYKDEYTTPGNIFSGNTNYYKVLRGSTSYAVQIGTSGYISAVLDCLTLPTPTPTPTQTPTQTPITPTYQYRLGTGTTSTNACNNYNPSLNNLYFSYTSPSGFTNGTRIYSVGDYPLSGTPPDGFYANSGYTWYSVSGILEGQSVCTYTPTPTPTPTQQGISFGIYTGATFASTGSTCGDTNYPNGAVFLTAGDTVPNVGDYFYKDQYTTPGNTFVGNGNFYRVQRSTTVYAISISSGGEITAVATCPVASTPTPTPTITATSNTPTPTATSTMTPTPTKTPLTPTYNYRLGTGVTSTSACINYDPVNSNQYYSYTAPSGFTNGTRVYSVGDYPLSGTPPDGFYANSGYTWYMVSGILEGQSICTYTPTPTPTPTRPSVSIGIVTGVTYSTNYQACTSVAYPNGGVFIANGDTLSDGDRLYTNESLTQPLTGLSSNAFYRLLYNNQYYASNISAAGFVSNLFNCNTTPTPTPTNTPTATITPTPTQSPVYNPGTIEFIATGTSTSQIYAWRYFNAILYPINPYLNYKPYQTTWTSVQNWSIVIPPYYDNTIPSDWFGKTFDLLVQYNIDGYANDNYSYSSAKLYINNVLVRTIPVTSKIISEPINQMFTGITVNNNDFIKIVVSDDLYNIPTQYKLGTGDTSTNACINYNPSVNTTYYSDYNYLRNGSKLYTVYSPLSGTPPNGYYSDGTNSWFCTAGTLVGQATCTFTPTPTPTPTQTNQSYGFYTGATYGSSSAACSSGTFPNIGLYLPLNVTTPTVGAYFYKDQYCTPGNTFVGNGNWYNVRQNSSHWAIQVSSGGETLAVYNCP